LSRKKDLGDPVAYDPYLYTRCYTRFFTHRNASDILQRLSLLFDHFKVSYDVKEKRFKIRCEWTTSTFEKIKFFVRLFVCPSDYDQDTDDNEYNAIHHPPTQEETDERKQEKINDNNDTATSSQSSSSSSSASSSSSTTTPITSSSSSSSSSSTTTTSTTPITSTDKNNDKKTYLVEFRRQQGDRLQFSALYDVIADALHDMILPTKEDLKAKDSKDETETKTDEQKQTQSDEVQATK